MARVTFEGLTAEEVLALPDEEMVGLVLCREPIAIRVGSSEILGQFEIAGSRLVLEMAQIDCGGEGVLPALSGLATKYAQKRGLTEVEWQVHATNCAKPNPKLQRILARRGFDIREIPAVGNVYHKITPVGTDHACSTN